MRRAVGEFVRDVERCSRPEDSAGCQVCKCRRSKPVWCCGLCGLYTIVESLLEELSFVAPEIPGQKVTIDEECTASQLADVVEDAHLSRYML